jgi:hypothetical protein
LAVLPGGLTVTAFQCPERRASAIDFHAPVPLVPSPTARQVAVVGQEIALPAPMITPSGPVSAGAAGRATTAVPGTVPAAAGTVHPSTTAITARADRTLRDRPALRTKHPS